jgi:putative Mn2+ efflux pump MntP
MPILPLLLFILPSGLDTLGVSISLGMKSRRNEILEQERKASQLPTWLSSAILFSLAETIMPLAGLAKRFSAHGIGTLVIVDIKGDSDV